MRGTPIIYLISLAAAWTLLTGSAVSAQLDEPIATAPPPQYEDLSMAIIENDLTQPAVNAAVSETATFAFTEIGGTTEGPKAEDKKTEGKKAGLDSVSLPSTEKVVLAARDAGEKGYDLVVISGGDSQGTVGFAQAYPETFFFDIDQPLPCVTGDGRADPSGTCEGGVGALPFNYVAVDFDTDQAAYLAGVIAASASRDDILGIISGTADCPDCNRTIEGFVLGARSVKPDIEVHQAFLADEGEAVAFGDPTSAKTFAKAFIDVYQPDVILPLTGSGSRGVIEAACEAGILAVGTDVDVSATHPELAECILTSIIKDYEYAVRESIFAWANGEAASEVRLGLADGHVGVTDEWTRLASLPVDLGERYSQAEQAVITGQVATCPVDCGEPVQLSRLPATVEPVAAPSPDPGD
jgi:basic membrane lipoprotein Med (substrate-binding protein (PBP1-ABC) superfamily)